ncbi:MAG: phosphoribosylaminoimidazolesuccinocarboxamide synthase [Candidatus Lokiarchaeota archaeon]|nr:phosphoribosylaminoimidazolesuccinocarboxamide synthase [Candidatus Lokiarchaeota archaeon]
MIDKEILKENLNNTLLETNFSQLGELYRGKVRDNYIQKYKNKRILIASDRLSAFDRVITTIPFKGQLLNQVSNFWFDKTADIAPNHVIGVPDPNVTIAKECKPFPIEMVVRGYITGSAWRAYKKGEAVSGIKFPEGLKKHQKLPETTITPSTKEEKGIHDEPISREEIIEQGIVDKDVYEQVEEYVYKLFEFGQNYCAKNNLILVDCKYEFGLTADDEIVLIDEIHTPDASRFWILDTYQEKFDKGEEPDILDKEFFRGWLMEQAFMGDGEIPDIPDDIRIELAQRYVKSYEIITGKEFSPALGNIKERIKKNLNL